MAGDKAFTVIFSPEAEEDIDRVVESLVSDNSRKAYRFSDDLRRVRTFLRDNPFMYQDYYTFLKRAPLRQSGYNLFYAIDDINYEVEIVAIFHQKESLDRLRERINL